MRMLWAIGLLAVLPLAACGGSDSPTTPAAPPPTTLPPRSVVTVSFNPDPVVATPNADPATSSQFPFAYTYTMTIRETAGLSGNVNFWTEALENPVTGQFSQTRTFGADRVAALAGTNHLDAMGTLRIVRTNVYTPGGNSGTGRAITIHVVVQVGDDKGNTINSEGVIRIL